jgi:GDPmannose 4,6-dehydratase
MRRSLEVHVVGFVNVLEALCCAAPRSRVFYAASSHVFGSTNSATQNEDTPFEPRDAYGISKAAGILVCRAYRERRGLHVSAGILYNHESAYRSAEFVSQRIVRGARDARAAYDRGETYSIRLGNLNAVADWGYAPDYVDAMVKMLGLPEPGDYVIATGIPHTVADFARIAFEKVGLPWQAYVKEDPSLIRKQTPTLVGNASKLARATGWRPTVSFDEMIDILLVGASHDAPSRRDPPS